MTEGASGDDAADQGSVMGQWEEPCVQPFGSVDDVIAAGDEGENVADLIDMLASDTQLVIARTVEDRSPEPARGFAARLAEADLLIAAESGPGYGAHDALGVTITSLVLVSWLTRVCPKQFDKDVAEAVLRAVHEELGLQCANAASVAMDLAWDTELPVGLAVGRDKLGDDLVPALVWLAAGLVWRFGDGEVTWLCGDDQGQPHESAT